MNELIKTTLTVDVTGLTDAQLGRLKVAISRALSDGGGDSSHAVSPGVVQPSMAAVTSSKAMRGWTRASLSEALRRLRDQGAHVQAECIERALRDGTPVDRAMVYQVGKYPENRSLRGFTRPVTRIVEEMRAEGEIGEEAPTLLKTEYAKGSVQADSFAVPLELAVLV